jgi:hypothetical protein
VDSARHSVAACLTMDIRKPQTRCGHHVISWYNMSGHSVAACLTMDIRKPQTRCGHHVISWYNMSGRPMDRISAMNFRTRLLHPHRTRAHGIRHDKTYRPKANGTRRLGERATRAQSATVCPRGSGRDRGRPGCTHKACDIMHVV